MTKLRERASTSLRSKYGWTVRWRLLSGGPYGGWHVQRRLFGQAQFQAIGWPEKQARSIYADGIRYDPANPHRSVRP